MNGHQALIAMRKARQVPRCVWVEDDDARMTRQLASDWHEAPNIVDRQMHAHLHIAESDIPEALDLRCVVGLMVHLSSTRGEARQRRLFNALIEAGAREVISVAGSDIWHHRKEAA